MVVWSNTLQTSFTKNLLNMGSCCWKWCWENNCKIEIFRENQGWAEPESKYKNISLLIGANCSKALDPQMIIDSDSDGSCTFKTILGLCVLVQLKTETMLMEKYLVTEL